MVKDTVEACEELDPFLLQILVCPITRGALHYDPVQQELISLQAKLAYPVRKGVPILLPEEARSLEEEALRSFCPTEAREG